MNKVKEYDRQTQTKAEHEAKKVRQKTINKSMLDILIYICSGFVICGGLFISYLGVSGGFTNQRVLALVILYVTLWFFLTGAFLYFYQNLTRAQESGSPDKLPHVFIKVANLKKPLTINEKVVVQLVLVNNGTTDAHVRFWDNTFYFDPKPFKDTFEYIAYSATTAGIAHGQEISGELRFEFTVTKEKLAALESGDARLLCFSRGEYQDSAGNTYPLPFCGMWDKDIAGNLILCTDGVTVK